LSQPAGTGCGMVGGRTGIALTVAALSASSCGGEDQVRGGSSTPARGEAAKTSRCSKSTRLSVKHVTGRPAAGFSLVESADPDAVEQLFEPFLQHTSPHDMKLDDIRVLLRGGAQYGTGVVILRATGDAAEVDDGGLLGGARASARAIGGTVRPVRLNGHRGVITKRQGFVTAMGVATDCAFIALYDDHERRLRQPHRAPLDGVGG
jgi:hypothetical protein